MAKYEYRVIGRGEFPLDMLRYDSCYPADGDSAAKIGTPSIMESEETYHKFRTRHRAIKLRSDRYPTEGRWSSFGWPVLNEDLYRGESESEIERHLNGDRFIGTVELTPDNLPLTKGTEHDK